MWTQNIGNYQAGNYALLKIIFEVNLKLFEQKSSKRLLFVLRDFNQQPGLEAKLKGQLEKDMHQIWSQIFKPEQYKDSVVTDFFKFEYALLPHKIWAEPQFVEHCATLKQRFVVGSENSLFLDDAEEQNVPMDGLSCYISQTWDVIRGNKELNLPNQRAMVAAFRCNEIKEDICKLVKPQIDFL